MTSLDQCIVDKCKEAWTEEFIVGTKNKDNCSGFVKAVAKKVGIPITETLNADGIVDEISKSSNWAKLNSGKDAGDKAATGALVVAGLKSGDHEPSRSNGHVVVVVSGTLYKDKYPSCWGGSIGSAQSEGTKSVGEVWNRKDRDSVGYWAYGVAACKAS
jgi:hypothetical protein